MQSRLALHGINESHVVDVSSKSRKQIAQPTAGVPVLMKGPETLRIVSADAGKGLFTEFHIKRLSVPPFENRLVIPRIDVTQPAWTENLDDASDLRGEMSGLVGKRIRR